MSNWGSFNKKKCLNFFEKNVSSKLFRFKVKSINPKTVPIPKSSTIGRSADKIIKIIKFFFSLTLINFQILKNLENIIGSYYKIHLIHYFLIKSS